MHRTGSEASAVPVPPRPARRRPRPWNRLLRGPAKSRPSEIPRRPSWNRTGWPIETRRAPFPL